MSLYDEVDREALADWLDQRHALRADAALDPSEYEGEPVGRRVRGYRAEGTALGDSQRPAEGAKDGP